MTASELTRLMTTGGDARIVLNPETGLNRYFSAPRPSGVLAYASSTANDISAEALAHLQALPGQSDHVRLLDFGTAKFLEGASSSENLTRVGHVFGTPAYMSTEQAAAKPLDARSDVFSFGALLYELLAGTRAFTGDSTAQILSAVLRDDPGPLEAPVALQQIAQTTP